MILKRNISKYYRIYELININGKYHGYFNRYNASNYKIYDGYYINSSRVKKWSKYQCLFYYL